MCLRPLFRNFEKKKRYERKQIYIKFIFALESTIEQRTLKKNKKKEPRECEESATIAVVLHPWHIKFTAPFVSRLKFVKLSKSYRIRCADTPPFFMKDIICAISLFCCEIAQIIVISPFHFHREMTNRQRSSLLCGEGESMCKQIIIFFFSSFCDEAERNNDNHRLFILLPSPWNNETVFCSDKTKWHKSASKYIPTFIIF